MSFLSLTPLIHLASLWSALITTIFSLWWYTLSRWISKLLYIVFLEGSTRKPFKVLIRKNTRRSKVTFLSIVSSPRNSFNCVILRGRITESLKANRPSPKYGHTSGCWRPNFFRVSMQMMLHEFPPSMRNFMRVRSTIMTTMTSGYFAFKDPSIFSQYRYPITNWFSLHGLVSTILWKRCSIDGSMLDVATLQISLMVDN